MCASGNINHAQNIREGIGHPDIVRFHIVHICVEHHRFVPIPILKAVFCYTCTVIFVQTPNCQIASSISISVLLRRNNNAVVAYSSLPRTTRSLGATPQYSSFNLFSSVEVVPKPHFIIFAVYFRC